MKVGFLQDLRPGVGFKNRRMRDHSVPWCDFLLIFAVSRLLRGWFGSILLYHDCFAADLGLFGSIWMTVSRFYRAPEVSKNDEFCIQNEKSCIKNEEFCVQNDEFCRSFSGISTTTQSTCGQLHAACAYSGQYTRHKIHQFATVLGPFYGSILWVYFMGSFCDVQVPRPPG